MPRLIGTVMGAVHLLPGTTFASFGSVTKKGSYRPEKRASLTLLELGGICKATTGSRVGVSSRQAASSRASKRSANSNTALPSGSQLRELKLPFNDRLGSSENVDRGFPCPRLLPQYFEPVPGYPLGIREDV